MSFFSASTHAAVCANPATLPTFYTNSRLAYLNSLPAGLQGLPEDINKLGWASVMAFDLKPYGPGNGVTLAELLAQTTLNCDDYCRLAIEIFQILSPSCPWKPAMIGWNGGPMGNHAQITFWVPNTYLMVDPTIGFMSRDVTLVGMTLGANYAPMAGRWHSFWDYNAAQRQNIANFNTAVKNSILNGTNHIGHHLYYFPSLHHFNNENGGSANWATPQSWNI